MRDCLIPCRFSICTGSVNYCTILFYFSNGENMFWYKRWTSFCKKACPRWTSKSVCNFTNKCSSHVSRPSQVFLYQYGLTSAYSAMCTGIPSGHRNHLCRTVTSTASKTSGLPVSNCTYNKDFERGMEWNSIPRSVCLSWPRMRVERTSSCTDIIERVVATCHS
jgi:hypothetical protein